MHVLAERLLAPVQDAEIDTLLLGCTHYPYLARTISDVMGRDVVLVSSATRPRSRSAACSSGTELAGAAGRGRGERRSAASVLSSGDAAWFSTLGGRLLGPELAHRRGDAVATDASTVLGCSGSYPGRAGVQRLPRAGDGAHVWVDCGPGTLANLQRHVASTDIDGIVLSHAIRTTGSTSLCCARAFEHYVLGRGLPVFGTAEMRERLEAATGVESRADVRLARRSPTARRSSSAACAFTCRRDRPSVETLAVRVDDVDGGRTLVYSADTGSEWSLSALGDDIDLALCEATLARRGGGHRSPHLSARAGRRHGPGRGCETAGAHPLSSPDIDPEAVTDGEAAEAFGTRSTSPRPTRSRDMRIDTMRPDGRQPDELRPITFERDFTETAAGSVLVSFGRTRVLCTASIDDDVPRWMRGSGKGWVTAEYSMLPGLVAGAHPPRGRRRAARRAARRRSSG